MLKQLDPPRDALRAVFYAMGVGPPSPKGGSAPVASIFSTGDRGRRLVCDERQRAFRSTLKRSRVRSPQRSARNMTRGSPENLH